MQPLLKPNRPFFSSGPTVKRPGWSPNVLEDAALGRSHRSSAAKAKINELTEGLRKLLKIPHDYAIAITPGSDTCAFEMGMWSLLGPAGVDVIAYDVFASIWESDIFEQLKLPDVKLHKGGYKALPDLTEVSPDRDIVFCWNGTTSGLVIPDGEWISANRTGLTFCDAISALFAYDVPWDKLDVTSFSWQKGLGGEAQHGILVLSPRALERLDNYTPPWPLPRLFRMTRKEGGIHHPFFKGDTINTPSLMAIEDALDALKWCENIGGLDALIERSCANLRVVEEWVEDKKDWIDLRVPKGPSRSRSSICLHLTDENLDVNMKWRLCKEISKLLELEKAAYDIKGHAHDAPGLRLWGGPMVEAQDIELVLPWIEWAYKRVR